MTNEIKRSVLLVAIMIVLCFVSSASSAQNLMITVKSDLGQPVSYAGISLNGRHMAATDSVGMGSIPLYRLSLGDTISVTYIGTTKGTAIFDQTMRRERSCNYRA